MVAQPATMYSRIADDSSTIPDNSCRGSRKEDWRPISIMSESWINGLERWYVFREVNVLEAGVAQNSAKSKF